MGNLFLHVPLKSINLKNFNTKLVTDMSLMFGSCSELTILDISSFDTSEVTNMNLIFTNCVEMTSLNLS